MAVVWLESSFVSTGLTSVTNYDNAFCSRIRFFLYLAHVIIYDAALVIATESDSATTFESPSDYLRLVFVIISIIGNLIDISLQVWNFVVI